MGHALWFTAWSFVFGIFAQRLNLAVPATLSGVVAVMAPVALLAFNLRHRFPDGESGFLYW